MVKKERTGKGSRVEVNLLSSALDLQAESLVYYFNGKKPDCHQTESQIGSWYHDSPYGIYKTADRYMGLSLGDTNLVLTAMGIAHTYTQDDVYTKRHQIAHEVGQKMLTKTYAQWEQIFQQNGVWYTEINDYEDMAKDPQIQHNGDIITIPTEDGEDLTVVANPVRYDGQVAAVRLPPQKLGAQTHEILDEIGISADKKQHLIKQGIVIAK